MVWIPIQRIFFKSPRILEEAVSFLNFSGYFVGMEAVAITYSKFIWYSLEIHEYKQYTFIGVGFNMRDNKEDVGHIQYMQSDPFGR